MKIAVISDIHSNLEALTSVLRDIQSKSVDMIWCLGDVVGYNADPDRCCEIVEKLCSIKIMGNHDSAVVGNIEPSHFNQVAKAAVMWARGVLKRSNLEFLKGLKSAVVYDDQVLVVHGAPSDPDRYIHSEETAKSEIVFMKNVLKRRICFFGHTHFPGAYELNGSGGFFAHRGDGYLLLEGGSAYLINPGSTGQPRDGDPRASYILFDRAKMSVSWERVSYDIRSCQDKIRKAGLPDFLAERLEGGY